MSMPVLKLRQVVGFPGNIVGGTGIEATKAHGAVTIDMQWNEFGRQDAIPTSPTNNILTFDTATGNYVMVPSSLLGGAMAGISDVTTAGLYARQINNWVALPTSTAASTTVVDYGGVMNVNGTSERTANAAAIVAMANALHIVRIPEGILYTDPVTVPNSTLVFEGTVGGLSTVQAVATTGGYTLSFSSPNLIFRNVRVVAPYASGTTSGYIIQNCTQGHIENVISAGFWGGAINICSNVNVINPTIEHWQQFGLLIAGASNNVRIIGGSVNPSNNASGASGISFQGQSTNCGAHGVFVDTPAGFGIGVSEESRNIDVIACRIKARLKEAINLDNSSGLIANNDCTGNSGHDDFLISVFAHAGGNCDNTSVVGNTVKDSGACGIAIATANKVSIRGNRVVDPCRDIASGGINRDAGILIYGNAQNNVIDGNHVSDTLGHMVWAVAEESDGVNSPNNNVLGVNFGTAGTSGFNQLLGANSICFDPNWVEYTPTISSTSGPFTSYALEEAFFMRKGIETEVVVRFQVTNAGSAGGAVTVSLPHAATAFAVVNGMETQNTGSSLQAIVGPTGTTLNIITYNNGFPGTTNSRITMRGTY